jgi:HAD superfamily hydrolase (TIGR01662 family)
MQLQLDDFVQDYTSILEKVWPRVLRGEITMERSRVERFQMICQKYGVDLTDDDGLALSNCYREAYQLGRRSLPGVVPLLDALRVQHIQIGIVSNNMLLEQQEKLAHLKLDHLIDFLVVSEEVGAAKPDPAMFEAALRFANCRASEAVMVGDSWSADIVGAHALGIRAVWLNREAKPCPDPTLAAEIRALEPLDDVLGIILQGD